MTMTFLKNVVTENKDIPEEALRRPEDFSDYPEIYPVQFRMLRKRRTGYRHRCRPAVPSPLYHVWQARRQTTGSYASAPQVLTLPFEEGIRRADRDNAIDVYIGEEYMDVLADGAWEKVFTEKPEVFTREEKREWLDQMTDVTLGSDAFFPFSDNIERAHKSGVKYIAEPGGSVRDDAVIETCNKYGMAMCFTGIRLFHH